ncbi:hypothetical protein GF339_17085 [candidate division KSB3 bacterium]|uniref:Uncharacterized protein n=1 Tax=candidate division KSB3 bacterium TaxID=2044937 RepID=A0A9D5JXZ1_9BACT|nr:hypothetical protein [candidate division KSB3 bacterium]MBD3326303.1 hypothetical protein [candidate division KSB3 bacterium]
MNEGIVGNPGKIHLNDKEQHMSKYNVSVRQSGDHSTSVVGDSTQFISNFTSASSATDLVKLLKVIRHEIKALDIPTDAKTAADQEVNRAIVEAQKDPPDKPQLAASLKNTVEIIKKSASVAMSMGKFWTLIKKALEWVS